MSEKIYAGNAKEITFDNGGKVTKILFSEEDVQKLQDGLNNGFVSLDIKERQEPSPKGYTHYGQIFVPKKKDDTPPF